jgi:hypothetical protein
MTAALTLDEAFGPTLEQIVLAALAGAARPARSAICPVCGGTMRRLVDASSAVPVPNALVCGECGSSLEDAEPAPGQLRLVSEAA